MSITLEQAKGLKYGDMVHITNDKNADGTPQRWRVNGKPKTWKRSPDRVKVPVKHGLYTYGYITEDNLRIVNLGDGLV